MKRALSVSLIAGFGCAAFQPAPFSADSLAEAMARRPVILLGEVHDNVTQHAVRADALSRLVAAGARPAIAFEQFDREHQALLDRARSEALPPEVNRVDHLIARAGGAPAARGWRWDLYRPYLRLALQYDLPIVAANLSRSDAMRVSRQGFDAAFDAATQAAFGLDRLPAEFLRTHERAVDVGHCRLMPSSLLPSLARAQIARDVALAQAIRPHVERGVVLLAGNGHVRNDIGVPYFLTTEQRARSVTIGLLESASESAKEEPAHFDVVMLTPAQARNDPCAMLRKRAPPDGG